jgi:hypothetical protein
MLRRTRYQQGSVQREKRRSGPDVWIYRWYETGTDGKSKYRKAIIGTVNTLANETSALKAAQSLRIDANQQAPHTETGPSTIAQLSLITGSKSWSARTRDVRHSRRGPDTNAI